MLLEAFRGARPRPLAAEAAGQPGRRLRGRRDLRGGPGPPADRPQRRRRHRSTTRTSGPSARSARSAHFDGLAHDADALGAARSASTDGRFPRRRRSTAADGAAPAHPFAGITIVEFGYFYAMPYGVAMAAVARRPRDQARGRRPVTRTAQLLRRRDVGGASRRRRARRACRSTCSTPEGQEIAQRSCAHGRRVRHRLPRRRRREARARLRATARAQPAARLRARRRVRHRRAVRAPPALRAGGAGGRGQLRPPGRATGRLPSSTSTCRVLELQAIVLPRLGQVVDGDSNAALAVLRAVALRHRITSTAPARGSSSRTSMIAGNAWAYADDFCTYAGKPPAAISRRRVLGGQRARPALPRRRRHLRLPRGVRGRRVRALAEAIGDAGAGRRPPLRLSGRARRATTMPWSRRSRRACSNGRPPSGSRR